MHRFYLFLLLLAQFCVLPKTFAQSAPEVTNIPGRIVFKIKPQFKPVGGASIYKLEKLTDALEGIQIKAAEQKFTRSTPPEGQPEAVDLSLIYQVQLKDDISLENACVALVKTGMVEYAETLRRYKPLFQPNDP